jgi:hypothetical protein
MYEDLNQIAHLKFAREIEFISKKTRERTRDLALEYAALAGSSGVRSGQQEASIGRAQIDGAEQLVRALYRIWVDLIKQRKGHISRPDIAFIAGKVDGYAQTQKGHLHKAFSDQRMGAVVNLLTQEAGIQMCAVAADTRRDLEIMVCEYEAFPKDVAAKQEQRVSMDAQVPKRITRQFANVLNVLVASPSDVNEERDVVTQSIHDWNAAHFTTTGIILNPVRWESHSYPASGDRPQAIVNKQIVESGDILIGLFGYKLGTPTGAAQSGTIEEIEEFRKAGKYVALYFSTADVPRNADRDQLESLEAYKKERQKDTLYFDFKDNKTLRDHLNMHLPKIVDDVRKQLEASGSAGDTNKKETENSAGTASDLASVQRSTIMEDIISELEDDLDRAERPRTGDVYRRPSNNVWLANRNNVTLPPDVRTQLKYIYHEIDSWLDIVNSGLNPNLGSLQLNQIVSGLAQALPPIILRLKALQLPRAPAERAEVGEGAIKSSDWERMAEKLSQSCRFLRADSQWTSDTRREVWRIAGGNGGMCEALLRQAGAMLLKSPNVRAQLSQEVLSETDNLSRWLLYLKQRGFHEASFPAYEELEDGTKITHLMGGIKDLPGSSAQLCIQCAALET